MQKTKKIVLLEWFKKTGNKVFQAVFDIVANALAFVIIKMQKARCKQITNPKLQIPNKLQITNFKIKNKNSKSKKLFKLLTLKFSKIVRFTFKTKARIVLTSLLLLTGITSSWWFFSINQNNQSNSSFNSQNQELKVSSNQGEFQIKKTKDNLKISGENTSITLNKIKTEKKIFRFIQKNQE